MKSPFDLRKEKILAKAKRLLYAGGTPPIKNYLSNIVSILMPQKSSIQAVTPKSNFNNGDIIKASEIVEIARGLQEDTDILQEWSTYLKDTLDLEFTKRKQRRESIEKRIQDVISAANEIDKYKSEGVTKGPGAASTVINFSDLSLIDFTRTTVDILPSAGASSDGEATLPKDPMVSRKLDLSKFFLVEFNYPEGSEILSPVQNIFNKDFRLPFQIILPGASSQSVTIKIALNKNLQPEEISGVELEGINFSSVKISTSLDNKNWTPKGEGTLSPVNRTLIRFNKEVVVYLQLELKSTKITDNFNGSTLGLKSLDIFNASYYNKGILVSQKLLADSSPLQGVKLNVLSNIPENTSVDLEVSFTSPDSGYIKSKRLTSQINGLDLVVWNPNTSKEELVVNTLTPPSDGSRFWKIATSISNPVLWDAEVFAGINQWFLESKEVNYSVLDSPYKIPTLEEWPVEKIDAFNGGVFIEPQLTVVGDISNNYVFDPISGAILSKGFLFKNSYSYGSEETTEHMLIVSRASNSNFMRPGRVYKLTSFVHCVKETSFELKSMLPGSDYGGGTFTFSYYLNGKSILTVGEDQVEGLGGWLSFSANSSFIVGWNKIEILVYRPDQTNELAPTLPAGLRFTLDPLSTENRKLYNISKMQCKLNSLVKTGEFSLKVLRNPGNRSSWAWEENSATPDIILSDSWGHDTTNVFLDGITKGVGASFQTSIRKGNLEDAPGVWIRGTFKGSGNVPPEIRNIKVEAI